MKRVVIIGGGISGLTVLHYLKQRLGDTVQIELFEREALVGGTIRSFKNDSCLFEWGPNGFLDNQPATLQLIEELSFTDHLIEADPKKAGRRFLQIKGELIALPTGPLSFITTSVISFSDKCALIKGLFKKNISNDQSIYDYVSQRFSRGIAESLIDPFISGIYAGDIKRLHMASAFPKLRAKGGKKSHMRSFKGGMGEIVSLLYQKYQKDIHINSVISFEEIKADAIVLSTPAYAAATIINQSNPGLAQLLGQMPYAPIAVVGLLFKNDALKKNPEGFGYLIPSRENKDILGVLIESNVYAGRASKDHLMIRVMLGGAHHPSIINETQGNILNKAIKEIDSVYGLLSKPIETFVKQWPQAIPQYETNYPQWRQLIKEQSSKTSGLHLCANYLDGISFNDCINNARILASQIQ